MGALQRFTKGFMQGAGLKTLTGGHPSLVQQPWWTSTARMLDTKAVGDGSANSVVVACLQVIAQGLAEAPLQHWAQTDPMTADIVWNSPVTQLWESPNPFMTSDLMYWYLTWATHVDGNGYIYKARDDMGEVRELWPIRPDLMAPKLFDPNSDGFIDYWEYTPQGKRIIFAPEDVIHVRIGMDPQNHRLGYAPLKATLREVMGDELASQYATALLKNMAIPGVVLVPDEPGEPGPTEEEAEAMREKWRQRFGGALRGDVMVASGRMKVEVVSFSPSQMDLKMLRRVPEERITAVMGVPAIIANLGAGLDRSTFANMDEAGEHFTERKLVPTWRVLEKQLTHQLRDDFDLTEREYLAHDIRRVRALQEELSNLWLRVDRSVRSGWITVADGRRIVGLPTSTEDEVYLRPLTSIAQPVGASIEELQQPQIGGGNADSQAG